MICFMCTIMSTNKVYADFTVLLAGVLIVGLSTAAYSGFHCLADFVRSVSFT